MLDIGSSTVFTSAPRAKPTAIAAGDQVLTPNPMALRRRRQHNEGGWIWRSHGQHARKLEAIQSTRRWEQHYCALF